MYVRMLACQKASVGVNTPAPVRGANNSPVNVPECTFSNNITGDKQMFGL